MIDVVMPQLGEDVAEGTVSQWFVREGQYVTTDQTLLEVETSKADVEIPSPTNGVIISIVAAPGEVVPKQGLLCRIDETATG
jgi:2-oxoglutarate dehydrogenase E2 component (dihydrolipoamide succinyltransferase)